MKPNGGLKGFVARPVGKVTLAAISTGILTLSLLFTGPLIAIPAFVIFGLGLPIYLGWKRPRQLALAGLAALLIAAPLSSAVLAYEVRQPTGAVDSSVQTGAAGAQGSLLQDGHVTPFVGAGGSTFTFLVEVHPAYLDAHENLTAVYLYVSTCQEVTLNSSPDCPAPFPHYRLNQSFATTPTAVTTVTFQQSLPDANIWYWNVGAAVKNTTGSSYSYSYVWLDPPYGYNAVPGPVTGDSFSTFGLLAPSVFETLFVYPGLVFAIALLIYVLLKNREARRKGVRDPAMLPPAPSAPGAPPPSAPGPTAPGTAPAAVGPHEGTCPNCQAVIYPHEVRCWKCGTDLSGSAGTGSPLSSAKSP